MLSLQSRRIVDEYKDYAFVRGSLALDSKGRVYAPNNARFESVAGRRGLLVEEGCTNLLTAVDSQGFSSPVNVTVTSGQPYTVSMTGAGSIALSGAGAGTVTAGAKVTVTAASTTLTLTPTGATGRVQVENKSCATAWQTGGTTRAAETLTGPTAGILSPTQGYIRIWAYVNALAKRQISGIEPVIFRIPRASADWSVGIRVYHEPASANWSVQTSDDAGAITGASTPDSNTPDGWHCFEAKWSVTEAKLLIGGMLRGTIANPKLPSAFWATFGLGCVVNGSHQLDSRLGSIQCGSNYPSDADSLAAYNAGFGGFVKDQYTTLLLNFDGPDNQRGARFTAL